MLGWFKKKFKKKEAEAETPLSEETVSPVETDETAPAETVQEETLPQEVGDDEIFTDDSSVETGEVALETEEPPLPEPEPDPGIAASIEIEDEQKESPAPDAPEIDEMDVQEVVEEAEELEEEAPPAPTEDSPSEEDVLTEEVEVSDTAEKPEQAAAEEVTEPEVPSEPEPEVEEETVAEPPKKQAEKKKKSLFTRLSDRLARTRESFTYQLDTLFLGKKEIDADLMDDLEELLITADLGVSTTDEILDHARRRVKRKELSDPNSLKQVIQDKIKSFIAESQEDAELVMPDKGPFVIMVIGVNGVGKTTTIGKIANKFVQSGQSVLLVAADTFRAAAISQLKIWGERNNVPVASHDEGSDPSSVVFDALAHANAKQFDVVLVDTAGRLHTQANLMEELKKIKRVMGKQLKGAPHEVLLVIDATTGQNGISQAKLFDAAVDITGIALTKLDGTAKGGIVANISRELKTPIRFIGIGETIEDLRDFDADEFVEALFQNPAAANQEDAA